MGNKHGKPLRGSNASAPAAKGGGGARGDTDARGGAHTLATAPPPPGAPTSRGATPTPPPGPAKMHPLLESKLSHLDVTAIFAPQEIQAIRKHLTALLGQREEDPIVINKEEFYRFLGTSTASLYVNRLYAIFDMAGKGSVTFDDLMRGLSMLSQKASHDQKLLLSFHILDADGKGYITKKTTTDLLRSCIAECKELDIHLSDEQIARIVDSTFEEADLDRNNVVDLQEYQALDAKHPGLFDFLTVDAAGVLHHLEKVQSMSGVPATAAE